MHEGHRKRMRDRYLADGINGFAPHEIFEMLLFYTYTRKNTNPIAHTLVDKLGPAGAFDADKDTLMSVPGIGEHSADFLMLVSKCMKAYKRGKQTMGDKLFDYKDAGEMLLAHARGSREEAFYVMCLNVNNNVTGIQKLSTGTIAGNVLLTREVIECVLRGKAHNVILAHSHIDRDLFVSQEDIEFNNRLCDALKTLGIQVVDHFIINEKEYISMEQQGFFRKG